MVKRHATKLPRAGDVLRTAVIPWWLSKRAAVLRHAFLSGGLFPFARVFFSFVVNNQKLEHACPAVSVITSSRSWVVRVQWSCQNVF